MLHADYAKRLSVILKRNAVTLENQLEPNK